MKTKPCTCCDGTGKEYDNDAVGVEMRKLRLKAGLTLKDVGTGVKPPLSQAYLCDLELGNRRWSNHLIAEYRRVCS